MTLQPAYGRDYKTAKEAKLAFYRDKDWQTDVFHGNTFANHADLRKNHAGQSMQLRFNQNRNGAVVKVLTVEATARELEKLTKPPKAKKAKTTITARFIGEYEPAEHAGKTYAELARDLAAEKPFNSLTFIMAYEGGELEEEEIIAGFQELINSGLVWQLQGSYGRMAERLIAAGLCTPKA